MNSFDAIIALSVMLAAFAVLIGIMIGEKEVLEGSEDSLKAKTLSLECASIIDSMYANSAEEYNDTIHCNAKANEVSSEAGSKTKTSKILTKAEKSNSLEVEMLEHYGK